MNTEKNHDLIDGQNVPQTYIYEDYDLVGTHQGTMNIESGRFRLLGELQGTLSINTTEKAEIIGRQQGTVTIDRGGHLTVTGSIQGTTTVADGATLIIEQTGKLAGTLTNNGIVIMRGVFGGAQSGNGELIVEENGHIKQPTIKNGISYYEW